MKRLFFNTAMMPIATAILGIAGAFATTSMGSADARVATMGYRYISTENPCDAVKNCQTLNTGVICRVVDGNPSSAILTGKNAPSEAHCTVTLYQLF